MLTEPMDNLRYSLASDLTECDAKAVGGRRKTNEIINQCCERRHTRRVKCETAIPFSEVIL